MKEAFDDQCIIIPEPTQRVRDIVERGPRNDRARVPLFVEAMERHDARIPGALGRVPGDALVRDLLRDLGPKKFAEQLREQDALAVTYTRRIGAAE